MKDRRCDIDVAAGKVAYCAALKAGTGGDECVMNVELTQRGVAALAGAARGVGDNFAGYAVAVRFFTPPQSHHHIGGIGRVRAGGFQWKRACKFFAGEDYAGEIGMLKPFHKPGTNFAVMFDDVEQYRAAIADDHDLPGLRRLLETCHGVEAGRAQGRRKVDPALDCGETVVRDNEKIRCFACLFLRENVEDGGEIAVGIPDGGQGSFGARRSVVLGEIGIAQPEKGERRKAVAPQDFGEGARGIYVALRARVVRLGEEWTEKAERFGAQTWRHWRGGEFGQAIF